MICNSDHKEKVKEAHSQGIVEGLEKAARIVNAYDISVFEVEEAGLRLVEEEIRAQIEKEKQA